MGHALATKQTIASESGPSHPQEADSPPPPHPAGSPTHAFDARNSDHQRGAELAWGHHAQAMGSAPGLGAPSVIDLGDRAVDTIHLDRVFVANNVANEAAVRVSYEGSPEIQLAGAPNRLLPAHEGFDPQTAIELAFKPQAKGHYSGTIIVAANWQVNAHEPQELRIPVIAAAHAEGEPDLATQEAEQRDHDEAERTEHRDREAMEHAKAAREDHLKHGKTFGNAASRERLHDASEDAAEAMMRLLQLRLVGVRTARDEAALYAHKEEHSYDASLLHALALAALDVATAGIAGALGKRLEGALLPSLAKGQKHSEPTKALVAFFTDAVKDMTKQSGKSVLHGKHGADKATDSPIARIEFFSREEGAVVSESGAVAHRATDHARNVLEPMLDTAPEPAVAAMRAIARQVEAHAEQEIKSNTQHRESALHWLRYVAQADLGTVGADAARAAGKRVMKDGSDTTNIASANVASGEHGRPRHRAGVVDVEFQADVVHAESPVTVSKVHVEGVSKAIAAQLAGQSLLTAGVPLRAYGSGLDVVRDEAGNVEYTDATGAPGMPSRWFERKAGEPSGGRDAAIRGARALMEEVAMKAADRIGGDANNANVETDSADR